MNKSSRIYVAGHRGLVGTAIMKRLHAAGYTNIVTKTHAELDLTRQADVEAFFAKEKPEYVFLCAAKVGGIGANSTYPADFIYINMSIALNVIHSAYKAGVKKLLNMGSSCIYPKMAPQPLKEDYLLTGQLEVTNEAYAIAKIAAIRLCRHYNDQYGTNFLSVMPTNLYGPGDNYDSAGSHVLPALIRKFHEAKVAGSDRVTLWGDGSPYREFLYSEDLAEAVVYLMEQKDAKDLGEFVNIGTGIELTIKSLAETVRSVVYADVPGRACRIEWDQSKPNGTPRKLLDVSRLSGLGWKAKTDLIDGIKLVYTDFLKITK
ncbi:MAG: GDP-L-fucose synthase [Treponemataceae bacterium]